MFANLRRYASAHDLAADIQRYLNDEPITARPPSAGYQVGKFARRHRALVAGVAVIFAVLVVGVSASTYETVRANRAGQAAIRERDRATTAERAATEDRDRALNAEQTANRERNRAVEAEAAAVQARNRSLTEKQRADDEAATSKTVNDFLQNDLLAQASAVTQARPDIKPDPAIKVRTALDRAAARISGKFDKQPLVEASIRQTIGATYQDLGVFPEAQKQIERAIELRRRMLGDLHPETVLSIHSLAEVYWAEGKYSQAAPLMAVLYRRAVAARGSE